MSSRMTPCSSPCLTRPHWKIATTPPATRHASLSGVTAQQHLHTFSQPRARLHSGPQACDGRSGRGASPCRPFDLLASDFSSGLEDLCCLTIARQWHSQTAANSQQACWLVRFRRNPRIASQYPHAPAKGHSQGFLTADLVVACDLLAMYSKTSP